MAMQRHNSGPLSAALPLLHLNPSLSLSRWYGAVADDAIAVATLFSTFLSH